MTRVLVVENRARDEIRRALSWWKDNRFKAPRAMADDLKSAFALIREHPGAGERVHEQRGIYRVFLRRVRYMLYYREDEDSDTVAVMSLWHASRGDEPALR